MAAFMNELIITDSDKILIIAPHPDDESIGAGGLIIKYPKQCDVWVLTDGRYGIIGESSQHSYEIRKKEFIHAMEYAGVNSYKMFNIEDGTLSEHDRLLHDIDLSRYSKIFVTNSEDNHIDHRFAFKIIVNAMIEQNLLETDLYQYEITEPLQHATHYFDITNIFQYKQELIYLYESQREPLNYIELSKSINTYRAVALSKNYSYYESYLYIDVKNLSVSSKLDYVESRLQKHILICKIQDIWLQNIYNKKYISEYLIKMGWTKIAIYGYGKLGKILYKDISGDKRITIAYIIDQRIEDKELSIDFVKLNSNMEKVDVIIVTAIFDYNAILKELKALGHQNIISLGQVVESM